MNDPTLSKVVFLDRDGTINKEKNYLYKLSDFAFIPGTVDAIKLFHSLGYLVVVITNQSGVARGYYKENDVIELHRYIDSELRKEGTWVDKFYYCPHLPDGVTRRYAIECKCRKPLTGMIERAVCDFVKMGINISLADSIIVGDSEIDMLTGKNAGIDRKILVRSGHNVDEDSTIADMVYDDLISFAKSIS